jgi:hypothetical protein
MYGERQLISIGTSKDFLSVAPQHLDLGMLRGEVVLFFRPKETRENVVVRVLVNGQMEHSQDFLTLRPSDVERLTVSFNTALTPESRIELRMENADLRVKGEESSAINQEHENDSAANQEHENENAINQGHENASTT